MKFFCEYCGFRIDANEDDKCPNCGASYKKNKTFLKLEEENKEKLEKAEELKDETEKMNLKTVKFTRTFVLIFFVIFFIITIFIIVTPMGIFKTAKNIISETDTKQKTEEIQPVTVNGLNTYGSIEKYGFMVTGYEVVTSEWPDDYTGDNECIKVHFQVQNTAGKKINREKVNCIVDGIAQNQSTFGHNTMPAIIEKDLTAKGTIQFMVPKNATSYDIKYGDYITIHIEK